VDHSLVTEIRQNLESIIENFPDAIVTFDLNGIVTSWNRGAEEMYGFTKAEAIGRFLPFVPGFLVDAEREKIGRIRNGEVFKDYETIRQKKDGAILDASLTLSPLKDTEERVVGAICISRDISDKKRIEKELLKRNQELSRLFFISSAMRGTIKLGRLLRMILTAVTMSDGLGFNRAILFLVDENKDCLRGAMGVGPASSEEAFQIWSRLSLERKTLTDIMRDIETGPLRKDSFLDKLTLSIEIRLSEDVILTKAVKERRSFNVQDVRAEPFSDFILTQQLGTQAYAVAPLISRDKVIGIIWVDNHFNRRPILDEDMRFLSAFSNQVASVVESAGLFEQVALAEQEMKNIFDSISDMVFSSTKDYVLTKINRAVSEKLGKPVEEIIGKKCYEVFHGRNEPRQQCPHHKTVKTGKPYVGELDEPYLGGTFLTSSSPIFDSAGEFIGTVHVARDITEIKKLQKQLIMAQRMAALGEVAARVAHDIRNPLVSIGGFARRLEKHLEGDLKEYAGIIAGEVAGLEKILSEILAYVRGVSLEKRMVSVDSLVEAVTAVMKSELDEKQIILLKSLNAPLEVSMDPGNVREALLNILSNAIHAIGRDGAIIVKTAIENDYAVIGIKDTGCGISEEILPFIFDPFFTTKGSGNTGLGLTISHKIIEKHNGRIEVESKPHEGSTFKVFLPLESEE
jgi:PAS domain S-box-containing protein